MKELKNMFLVGLVIVIAGLLCLQAGAVPTTPTVQRTSLATQSLDGNVLISVDNPDGDDMNPKVDRTSGGTLVVTYEKQTDIFVKTAPVVISEDQGETWTPVFEIDSTAFSGSGLLNTPDITYSPEAGGFYIQAIDPEAMMYNQEFWFVDSDFTYMSGIGISGQGSFDYQEGAITSIGMWSAGMDIEAGHQDRGCGMGWFGYFADTDEWLQPADYDASWAAGFYYDGESQLTTHPAWYPEMDTGDRAFMVMQVNLDEGSKIAMKATVTDLNPNSDTFVFTSGGGYQDMDKYADIEVWPWQQYVADGTNPDVSASGSNVAIVYADGGDVKCSYSSDSGDTFAVSTVASGAGFPAVHVAGNTVSCAYVKDNNVYKVVSEDGGANWGDPVQLNDEDGSVVAEPGAVDLNDLSVVWVDNRDGQKDIYTAAGGAAVPLIGIKSIGKGFGVTATIENTGTADAVDLECAITIDATLMIIGGAKEFTINVAAGGETDISTGLILGFGPATITVTAGDASQQATGTVLGPFVL